MQPIDARMKHMQATSISLLGFRKKIRAMIIPMMKRAQIAIKKTAKPIDMIVLTSFLEN